MWVFLSRTLAPADEKSEMPTSAVVLSAEGCMDSIKSLLPALRPPAAGSLVARLVQDPILLRRMGSIVVDVGDDLSFGLLRGRLNNGQALVLVSTAEQATSVNSSMAELGKPRADERNLLTYISFPPAWLDPLDEHYRPVSPIVAQLNWRRVGSRTVRGIDQGVLAGHRRNFYLGQ